MSSTIYPRILPVALVLGFVSVLCAGAASGDHGPVKGDTFRPIQAMSYVFGTKRMVGYFDSADGKCQLTLMIAEAVDPDLAPPPSAARVSLSLAPGQVTSLDSAEHASIALTCGAHAQTVQVTRASVPRS
jgi:hypothetical protein